MTGRILRVGLIALAAPNLLVGTWLLVLTRGRRWPAPEVASAAKGFG